MGLYIFDTADVVVERKSDGEVFVSTETQMASITQSLGIDEKIFGSIGNKPLAIIKGQKEVSASFRNAFYNQKILEMTQGVKVVEDGTATVPQIEKGLLVVENASNLEVTLTGTPVGTTAHVTNPDGSTISAAITSKVVTIPTGHASAGEYVNVTYDVTVTGDILELESDKFSGAYKITYSTIAMDSVTNQVVKDIIIQLDHVVPTGDMEISLENGSAIAPEITFDCLAAPNTNKIGRIIEKDRA